MFAAITPMGFVKGTFDNVQMAKDRATMYGGFVVNLDKLTEEQRKEVEARNNDTKPLPQHVRFGLFRKKENF